jgi:hypothetical protein
MNGVFRILATNLDSDPEEFARTTPCSFRLSATNQQYFSLRTNQPSTNQPTVLFSQNKPAPATSHQPNEQAVYVKI